MSSVIVTGKPITSVTRKRSDAPPARRRSENGGNGVHTLPACHRARMESPVLGVGPGVLILALVWILAVAFGAMLWGSSWPSKLMVVPLCLAAVVVTVALASFPRSPETGSPFAELEIVDTFFIGRYVLLSVASAAFLAALFLLLPHHFLEPVYAKALRTR